MAKLLKHWEVDAFFFFRKLLLQQHRSNERSNFVTSKVSTALPCYSRIFLTSLVALYGPVPITSPSIPQDYFTHRTLSLFFGRGWQQAVRGDVARETLMPTLNLRVTSFERRDWIASLSTWSQGCHPLIVSEIAACGPTTVNTAAQAERRNLT